MTPIDMVLHCTRCGMQHIDAESQESVSLRDRGVFVTGTDEFGYVWSDGVRREYPWTNQPHRSHKCARCAHVWRPADVETNGVAAVQTKGKADSPIHDCLAGHTHSWRESYRNDKWVGSECRHCGAVLPF